MKELLVNIWTECCTRCNCNSPDVVEGRHEYANWFLEEANIHHYFFIVKYGSIFGRPGDKDGLALDSVHAYRQVCEQKGRNLTICLAVHVSSFRFGALHRSDGLEDQRILHRVSDRYCYPP